MIILNNSKCGYCRQFEKDSGGDAFVFDWYEEGQQVWLDLGFHGRVGGFPIIPIYVPAHRVQPEGQEMYEVPENDQFPIVAAPDGMTSAQAQLDDINARLAASAALGLPAAPTSFDSLDDRLRDRLRARFVRRRGRPRRGLRRNARRV